MLRYALIAALAPLPVLSETAKDCQRLDTEAERIMCTCSVITSAIERLECYDNGALRVDALQEARRRMLWELLSQEGMADTARDVLKSMDEVQDLMDDVLPESPAQNR